MMFNPSRPAPRPRIQARAHGADAVSSPRTIDSRSSAADSDAGASRRRLRLLVRREARHEKEAIAHARGERLARTLERDRRTDVGPERQSLAGATAASTRDVSTCDSTSMCSRIVFNSADERLRALRRRGRGARARRCGGRRRA